MIIENEIKNVWDRASIPAIAFESIVKGVSALFNKYRSYRNSINKTSRESKKKRLVAFGENLGMLNDVYLHANLEVLCPASSQKITNYLKRKKFSMTKEDLVKCIKVPWILN